MLTYGLDNILAVLTLILVSGTVLTVPTAMLLLRLFRRSVQKGMTAISQEEAFSGDVDTRATSTSRACGPGTPLAVRVLNGGVLREVEAGDNWYDREAARSIRRTVLIYSFAGFAFAVMFALCFLLRPETGLTFGRLVWVTACFWWPAVLAD
jgi:hypothetical protein